MVILIMSKLYYYRTFGLSIAINCPVPFLVKTNAEQVDCLILLHGNTLLEELPTLAKQTTPISWEWRSEQGAVVIRFHDPLNQGKVEFRLQPDGRQMEAWWGGDVSQHDVIRVCTSIMMGRILYLFGKLALHASSVQIGDYCILLAASSGAGKSSTTAALLNAGAALLSDDIVCINHIDTQFVAAHGFAQLRLWPDSASKLIPNMASLLNVYERTALIGDKRYWDLAHQPKAFYAKDCPIQAIYLLGERRLGSMSIQPIPPRQAVGKLLGQLYLGQTAHPSMWQKHFPILAKLAQQIPIFSLQLAEGLHNLHNTHDLLLSHINEHAIWNER